MNLSGYSTALFSTWFFLEELGILFDAGDGVTSCLTQKSRKIKHVFITHADRDHLTGLLQLNQLNAREGFPKIYYPEDCGSFPALRDFSTSFDPHVKGAEWIPLKAATVIDLGHGIQVRTMANDHVETPTPKTKSLSYIVEERKKKLKPEYQGLPGPEMARLSKELGADALSDIVIRKVFGYSGDTPVNDDKRWWGVEILLHEATFLKKADITPKGNRHSSLEEVIAMAAPLPLKALVLSHFSARYSPEEITAALVAECQKHQIKFPIHTVLPGVFCKDILSGRAHGP
ncbi:MAG: ribonuclease [Verrucomicrobia bacterium]|jgi:ribonuclease Z|nr:ribonuclease [Verrucomicrobiota bacterium]